MLYVIHVVESLKPLPCIDVGMVYLFVKKILNTNIHNYPLKYVEINNKFLFHVLNQYRILLLMFAMCGKVLVIPI